jgi:hypothetical protein
MKKLFPFLFLLLFAGSSSAQHQVFELMERTDLTIQEVETRANRHFDSTGTGRGTGYKQFQRWLYERKFHTNENGYYISPQTDWNNYLQSRSSMRTEATAAANWTPLGPSGWTYTSGWNPGTGRLSAIAIHPANENIIYVGSPGGGLWKSINAGASWVPLTDNNSLWMSIFAITIDPLDQNTVYVGTSNGILLKSTNAGSTFTPTGAGPSGTIRKVLIHPSSTNIVFATASNGIWRSINGGTSWTQVHTGSKEDIEFKPNDVNIMYASGNDVVRSINNGVTWTTLGVAEGITNSGRTLVSVSAADPNIVYAVQASGSLFGRMYRSTDAGLNFTTTVVGNPASGTNYFGYAPNGTGTSGQATYDMGMDVSPTNADDVYIAGIICWRSTNGATSFTALTVWSYPNGTGYNHADVHGLFWINSTIYSISDGGIYKSIDNGDNWTDLSPGLTIRQFYRMANSQTNASVITGGAQDNGSVTRQASGSWADWLGADGMEGLVSPTNHLNLWGTSQGGAIYRSTNGGNSYSGLSQPSSGQWVTPLAIHPTNETILYGGWTGVYKSTNSGTNWTNISSGFITSTLADLAVAPSDPNYIYASTGSTLYVTTNDGLSWATRSAPATINDIAVDPANPSKIWIACNSTTNRVMVSTDAGATFANVSANLPAIVARAIVVDDNTPRGIYVGMNIGVYYKTEPDANWSDYSLNLPLVAINELEIQKVSGKIRVATYGRSIWESPVADVAPPVGFTFNSPAPASSSCPAPATMSITLGTIASGGFTNPITLTATAGVPAGTNISFGTNPVTPGNSSVINLNNANTLPAGSYVITITGTAAGAPTQTRDLTYTITAGTGPVITVQPANQTVCVGGNTSFSITSAGATSFQWQVSIDGGSTYNNLANGGVYSGAATATLNITGATAVLNNYRYRCIASTLCGSTTSNAGILTVNAAAALTGQPQDVTLCAGSNHTFTVTATGAGLTYQWQSSPAGCTGPWTNIPTATSASYTLTGITIVQNNTGYRCVVTGTCAPAATSNCAVLTVVTSVSIASHPNDATACAGANASFTVAGSGSGIIYQWQLSTDGGATYINIAGANSATYTVTGVTLVMNNNKYRCQLSNATCTAPGVSNAGTLTVNSLPAITTNPQDATVCAGSNNTFGVAATGTGITYQWQISTDGGATYSAISGAANSTYTVTGATAGMNGNRYRCVATGICTPAAISNAATFTVISPVSVTTQPVASVICSGSNTGFTVTGSSTQTIIYQWQVSNDGGNTYNNISNGGVYSGVTTAALTITGATTALSYNAYRCQLSNATCTVPTASLGALLIVRQLPTVTLAASPLTSLLPGQTTTLTATPSASTGGILTTAWLYNGAAPTPAITGNSYVVNVEHIGAYQVLIQETFTSPALVCANQSAIVTINATVSGKLFIFPSPNDGQFTVSYYNNGGTSTSRTVTVYDSKGAKIYNAKFPVTGSYTLLGINIKPALSGIYYVVVADATGKKLAEGKILVH